MSEEIIKAIVYTSLDESIGPNPLLWLPLDLAEKVRMGVSIKAITMLSTDQGVVPQSLVIIPFPSFKLKGIVKYIERKDDSRRGGVALSSLTLLFNEANDLIFYKYMDYLETTFTESAHKLTELENGLIQSDKIFLEINNLREKLTIILNDLKDKEKSSLEPEAFPEENREELLRYQFKIVVCGDPEVGKTSTILRFTDNAFVRTYIATLGVGLSEKRIKVNNRYINLILWDIAGQSKFELMRRHFYQGAQAAILIFDLSNYRSFENVSSWFKDIQKILGESEEKFYAIILGNKEDLVKEREVNFEEALDLAKSLNLEYIEISALTGKNVEESFYKIAETLVISKKLFDLR